MPMGGGVLVGRVVAAADMSARHAHAQVDPLPTDADAVFARYLVPAIETLLAGSSVERQGKLRVA